jgi:hypothetical protein
MRVSPEPLVARAWHRLEIGGGPPAREDQTWTVDADGRYAYLFGGRDGSTVYGDLWRFDLAADTWTRLNPKDSPPARFGHTATWVQGVGLVLFAGQAGGGFFNDIWAYTPASNAWRRLRDGGSAPEPRYGSCAALAPDGRLWISHGFTDEGRFSDTRAYDFAAQTWSDITREDPVPVIRCLHDCVFTPDGRFVLYGGQTNGVAALGDLWARPVDGDWIMQPDPPLQARQLVAVAVLRGTAWIFGGADIRHAPLRDLWTLDLTDLSWHEVQVGGSIPPARLSATFIPDPARSRLLLFGGKTENRAFDDLWELRLGN